MGVLPDWAHDVQGNVWPGFNKDHQAFVLISIPDGAAARRWLRGLALGIASAPEVFAFNTAFKLVRKRLLCDEERVVGVLSATWANVAFTYTGLQRIPGARQLEELPQTFRLNRVPWSEPQADDADVHALLIVAADRASDLERELHLHRERMVECGLRELRTYRGATLPGEQRGQEHFGFKDLISQPVIVSTGSSDPDSVDTPVGEVILGEPDAAGTSVFSSPEWSQHGSFLVFFELEQHVEKFRSTMQREASRIGFSHDDLAARLVGRRQNGSDLADSPPRLSHIGRAYPRWLPANEAARHRILRRGIPYGPPLPPGEDDDVKRGVLFVAYQADIARQFEHVWKAWLNDPGFPGPGAGSEAIVGQAAAAAEQRSAASPAYRPAPFTRLVSATIARENERLVTLNLGQFVTPHYGGYFFSPSLSALVRFADKAPNISSGK
jgi:Dyp-type peroxidase family